jgi:hypothetical protein
MTKTDHDFRDLGYRVRIITVAEIVDKASGEVIVSGDEEDIKNLYRILRRRRDERNSDPR